MPERAENEKRGWVEIMRTKRRAEKRKEAGMEGERESRSSLLLLWFLLSSSFSDFPSLSLSPHLEYPLPHLDQQLVWSDLTPKGNVSFILNIPVF